MEAPKKEKVNNLRKHTRFKPEVNCLTKICLNLDRKNFTENIIGLAISESYGGCAVAVRKCSLFSMGMRCLIVVGELGPIKAEVVWIEEVDLDLIKVGFKYLE